MQRMRWTLGCRRAALAALMVVPSPPGQAQPVTQGAPIERHRVVVPSPRPSAITIDAATYGSDDTTPYGVNLVGVTLIGEDDAVLVQPADGVIVEAAPQPEGKGGLRAALASALLPTLGRPLSAHEIAALQATVAAVYRSFGMPFISVTAPPQEITDGVIQLRVIAFRAGTVTIDGTNGSSPPDADVIEAGIRLKSGDTIDGSQLSEDIDWLNRNPYRHVGAVFSPGEAIALSNLSLEVDEAKPWTLSAGWSNSGSNATGLQRYSVGAGVFLPWANGTTLSVLLTGGDNLLAHPDGLLLSDGDYPAYLSEAARVVIPTFARQEIEFAPNLVATRQDIDALTSVQNLTFELPITYRTAVSNLLPGHYWGDLYGVVTFKGLERKVYYSGSEVSSGSAALMEFAFGWTDTINDSHGQTAFDVSLVANPGATLANSDDAAWSSYTNGRVTNASYLYGVVNLTRHTQLPPLFGNDGFSLVNQFTGVFANTALPDTERLALGGTSGSRGYDFSAVAVDQGVVLRNELHAPALSTPADFSVTASLSPYLFADAAWGEDLSSKTSETMVSLGAGVDVAISDYVTGRFVAGRAMTDAGPTKAGSWTVFGQLDVKF